MHVLPFVLLDSSILAGIVERGENALHRWEKDWGALSVSHFRCASASGATLPVLDEWPRYILDNGASVWCSWAPELPLRLHRGVFGLDVAGADQDIGPLSPIVAGVVTEALQDLVGAIATEITGRQQQQARPTLPPKSLLRQGSGAVVCVLETGIGALCWLLPYDALPVQPAKTPPASVPLTPLRQAIAATQVTLHVELARTELPLGYLQTLAVGDVLTLPVKLNQALRVSGPGDTTICGASLGTRHGARAIELIAF